MSWDLEIGAISFKFHVSGFKFELPQASNLTPPTRFALSLSHSPSA